MSAEGNAATTRVAQSSLVGDTYTRARRKSKVGDWIWFELLAGRSESEITRGLRDYVAELADRLIGEDMQGAKS